jgi:putative FmdB family regulatory protein
LDRAEVGFQPAFFDIVLLECSTEVKMPIYEYVCDDCGEHYERIVMSQKQAITCPKCESAKHTIQLSVFAAPGNGSKASGGSSSSAPSSGSGGACCGGGCGCH